MNSFSPSEYFDLSSFEHSSLFQENEPIWAVFKKIGPYLSSKSLGGLHGEIAPGAILINPESISIGKGTIVESGAYIIGPCIIGEYCQIRQGAYIRENVLVGNHCVVGHTTEVKNSIFLDGAQAGHFAYIGDSVLGNGVNLGAGTKLANVCFDKKSITIFWKGEKIDTGLRKFGAIIGDEAQTGCNAVTNPGTIMGKKSFLFPCTSVKGVIPENHFIKPATNVIIAPREVL